MEPNSMGRKAADNFIVDFRRAQVEEYLLCGWSLRAIADKLDISTDTAWRDWQAINAMRKAERAARAEELLSLELDRLDAMQQALWAKAKRGDIGASNAILKIMERRSRLLGLDAPTKADVTTNGENVSVVVYIPDNERDSED
jgi:hypothetical protein